MCDKNTESIEEEDIMYQDDLVCILRPEIKKGIVVFTYYGNSEGINKFNPYEDGLKTGKQLHSEGIDFGRTTIHPYIFFRAPFYSKKIDYSTIDSEIISSYGEIKNTNRVFIRVDPDKTFVFSSEIRDIYTRPIWYDKVDIMIENSKKSLSEYLTIIQNNVKIEQNVSISKKIYYHLFSSEAKLFPKYVNVECPYDESPINYNSEILVKIDHLTPEYFVPKSALFKPYEDGLKTGKQLHSEGIDFGRTTTYPFYSKKINENGKYKHYKHYKNYQYYKYYK